MLSSNNRLKEILVLHGTLPEAGLQLFLLYLSVALAGLHGKRADAVIAEEWKAGGISVN